MNTLYKTAIIPLLCLAPLAPPSAAPDDQAILGNSNQPREGEMPCIC